MTTATGTRTVLRRAAARAVLAPSVHNTQPWRFVLTDDTLEIHRDPARRLAVLDPRGRQLLISCGCAVFHARVAVAAAGYEALVERFPDPARPDLLARVRVGRERSGQAIAALDEAIDARHTNRRAYGGEPVPPEVVHELVVAARAEAGVLVPVATPDHRAVLASLTALANQLEQADPAYRAEVRAWTTDDPRRRDGVPAAAVPYSPDGGSPNDTMPIRTFDVRGMGWLPTSSHSGAEQCLLLLCSHDDDPAAWLTTGEALEHVWLELTRQGYWASPLTQVIELDRTRDRLRAELGLRVHPEIVLRVGRAPYAGRTPRRPASEVVVEI